MLRRLVIVSTALSVLLVLTAVAWWERYSAHMTRVYAGDLVVRDSVGSPNSVATTRFAGLVPNYPPGVELVEAFYWDDLGGDRVGFFFRTSPAAFDRFASATSLRQPADATEARLWMPGSRSKMSLLFKRPLPESITQLWAGDSGGVHYELWTNDLHTDVYLVCETGNAVYQ